MIRYFSLVLFGCLATQCLSTEPTETPPEKVVATFYQQIDIQRNPRFFLEGMQVDQQIHYQIVSAFELFAPDDQGDFKATQTINDAILVQADPLSQMVFTESLAKMKGRSINYKVNQFGEVISMEGHLDNTNAVAVNQPKSQGMLVSTVIDADGWKELAQLTLFHPPQAVPSKKPFVRQTSHDWGSLGSWYGQTHFSGHKVDKTRQRFTYRHQLEYFPPNKKGPNISALPFSIENAKFHLNNGTGDIQYDSKQQHVTAVRELFHAKGSVTTSILGAESNIEIEEQQIFTIEVAGFQKLTTSDSAPRQKAGKSAK